MPKFKKFNEEFFDKWSKEMAYVLGFLTADGAIFTNPRGSKYFAFYSADKVILEKIKNTLNSEHKIGVEAPKIPHYKYSYKLQIGSKKVVSRLEELGIIENKTFTLKFPKKLPSKFLPHFIRGYFDGDGGVHLKQHYRKDRNKMNWLFRSYFTSRDLQFLKRLHKVLKNNLKGGYIKKKNRGFELIFSQNDSFILFNLMYGDIYSNLFLKRKYNIFLKAVRVLDK